MPGPGGMEWVEGKLGGGIKWGGLIGSNIPWGLEKIGNLCGIKELQRVNPWGGILW